MTHCLAKTKTNWSMCNFGLPPRSKWVITQSSRLEARYRRFGTSYRSHH